MSAPEESRSGGTFRKAAGSLPRLIVGSFCCEETVVDKGDALQATPVASTRVHSSDIAPFTVSSAFPPVPYSAAPLLTRCALNVGFVIHRRSHGIAFKLGTCEAVHY